MLARRLRSPVFSFILLARRAAAQMLPSIQIAGFRIWTWGLMNSLAMAAVLSLAYYDARYRRIDPAELMRMAAWSLVGGFVGAHLYYIAAVGPSDFFRLVNGTAIQG